jgi:large subunit ribosomal protein L40e
VSYFRIVEEERSIDEYSFSIVAGHSVACPPVSHNSSFRLHCVSMRVVVKTMTSKMIELDVHPDDTVEDVYAKISAKEGVPVDQQRLVLNGRQIECGRTMRDMNVRDSTVLMLILRMRGGGGGLSLGDLDGARAETEWSKSAPAWRYAQRGLCIDATCSNKSCPSRAGEEESNVIVSLRFGTFDVLRETRRAKCPACGSSIMEETAEVTFNNCKWSWTGRKAGESDKTGSGRVGDKYLRFTGERVVYVALEMVVSPLESAEPTMPASASASV